MDGLITVKGRNLGRFLEVLSSKRSIRSLIYACTVIFFFALILLPPILGILLKWNLIGQIFENSSLMSRAMSAIYASFAIALFVSIIDVIAGLPMAWFIWKGKSKWLNALDTLADIPFIVPTVALGYSIWLFWSNETQGISSLFGASLVSPGWLLIILVHFVFSYPAVVRVMVGALFDYKRTYEEASRTLGAAPVTADRTVTFPILKTSFIAAFTLAFARSISETGATVIVAGTFENGPVLINNLKTTQQLGYEGALVFVSFILIAVSCMIFATIMILGPKLKMPVRKVWPVAERKLSSHGLTNLRNTSTLLVFFVLVLIPGIWQGYWQSLSLSYGVAFVATLLNTVAGLPMAILIARKRLGVLPSTILDVLVNIPMIVPSIALGVSLSIFWNNFPFIPEIGLLLFAHLSITYPYFVRSMTAAIERVDMDLEEASKTLGAKPFAVFRTIILPLTKYSLFAGAIMMFTRSVSETGATLAVVTELKTAPVLLVEWVKQIVPASPMEIGLGCGFLIILSFVILLISRGTVRGRY